MVSDSLFIKDNNIEDLTSFINLGRKSYENFIIHSNECDLDLAISSFEKALELDPQNAEAHYKLASLLWEKGHIDIETAITRCSQALQYAPDCLDARLYLGYFFKASGCTEEAIKQFEEAAKLDFMKSAKPRIALGVSIIQHARKTSMSLKEILIGLGHFSLGLLLFANDKNGLKLAFRSLKEDFTTLAFKLKGSFLEMLGLNTSAFNIYHKAIDKVNSKEIFYEKIGDMQLERKNYIIAADYYRKAISFNPTSIGLYYKAISVLDEEIDTKEIINYYKTLCSLEPENHVLRYNLGQVYIEDKNYFGAIDSIRKAIEIEPENPFYHNSMAYTLVQVEDFKGAINEYHQAISLNPDDSWTSIVCQAVGAIYYQALRNTEAAIMSYQMSLNIEPENVEALIALAEIQYDKGNYDSAITCYTRALKIDNENPQAFCNLGFVYWEKGEVEDAIKNYQHAIAIYPEYDIAYNNLGVAYLDGINKDKLALKMFDLAIKNNPNYALAYYNKGRTLEQLGKKPKAADYYQMALDINTFTNELNSEEIEKRLSKLFNVD